MSIQSLKPMHPGKAYSPQTALAAPISATATEIILTDASVLPDAPNIAVIGINENAETILYETKVGNTLGGIVRGIARPNEARAWNTGAVIARNITSLDLDTIQENVRGLHSETESGLEALETHLDERHQAHGATPNATANTLMSRRANATVDVGDATNPNHAVNLRTMERAFEDLPVISDTSDELLVITQHQSGEVTADRLKAFGVVPNETVVEIIAVGGGASGALGRGVTQCAIPGGDAGQLATFTGTLSASEMSLPITIGNGGARTQGTGANIYPANAGGTTSVGWLLSAAGGMSRTFTNNQPQATMFGALAASGVAGSWGGSCQLSFNHLYGNLFYPEWGFGGASILLGHAITTPRVDVRGGGGGLIVLERRTFDLIRGGSGPFPVARGGWCQVPHSIVGGIGAVGVMGGRGGTGYGAGGGAGYTNDVFGGIAVNGAGGMPGVVVFRKVRG